MSLPELNYDILHLADGTFSALCGQVSRDYIKFAKKRIFPQLDFDDLSYRELRVLLCVAYFKNPMSGANISNQMRYDPATVSRATTLLIEAGYVEKASNVLDFRSTLYKATEKGVDVVARYRALLDEAYVEFDAEAELTFSPSEKEQLYTLLTKLRDRTYGLSKIPKKKSKLRLVK